ncbi:hypothetical protein ASG60_08370 [Methylobacterium sp. Leaf469]|uniref:hypothetical protein n=1 Tax=Methylobacterium sp. Leaf469 TaxID=1736387 RepID=UPI0006FF635B|nr:hypothetical protein [Methylobacterium sp. Leaf469]KQT93370.1 hypothetical protein ASG60_08370 [Methylobacterium sp. Leaf469]
MSHMSHISMEASGCLAQGMALGVMAVDTFGREIRRDREANLSSVEKLAFRLREARRDQRAALDRAAQAEQALAAVMAENAVLKSTLRREQALTAGLREVLGV